MKNILFIALILSALSAKSQNIALSLSQTITTDDLHRHLSVLTSDSLEGRETGTSGNLRAGAYIARHFQGLGLPPVVKNSFFQPIIFTSETWNTIKLSINGKEYAPNWDFYALPSYNSDLEINASEVVFCGYGIEDNFYNDYKKARKRLKDKVLLIYGGEPTNSDGVSLITNSSMPSDWSFNMSKKVELAYRYGAKAVLIIDGNLQKNLDKYRNQISNSSLKMGDGFAPETHFTNSIFISTEMAKNLIGDNFKKVVDAREMITSVGKTKRFKIPCQLSLIQNKKVNKLKSNNVLGFIEGSDEKLKNEIVVITAHYDHLGKKGDGIYYGADDDGSGTCAVLEIAEAFATAQRMGNGARRSVLCMLVTGEEKGLLGSQYYVNHPIFPLAKTIADVNIDMVGRVDEAHEKDANYIYVIGADKLSQDLHDINETANKNYTHLTLDYKYNDEADPNRYYYRSDHYNFAVKNIPAIFYFNGTHADYHRPTDTIEKINFEALANRAKLAFFTAWELANRADRIRLNEKK